MVTSSVVGIRSRSIDRRQYHYDPEVLKHIQTTGRAQTNCPKLLQGVEPQMLAL